MSTPQDGRLCARGHFKSGGRARGRLRSVHLPDNDERSDQFPRDEGLAAHLTDSRADRLQHTHPEHSGRDSGRLPHRPLHLRGFSATSPRQAAQDELAAAPRAQYVRHGHDRDVPQASSSSSSAPSAVVIFGVKGIKERRHALAKKYWKQDGCGDRLQWMEEEQQEQEEEVGATFRG